MSLWIVPTLNPRDPYKNKTIIVTMLNAPPKDSTSILNYCVSLYWNEKTAKIFLACYLIEKITEFVIKKTFVVYKD